MQYSEMAGGRSYPLVSREVRYNNEMFTTSLVAAVHKVKGHYKRK